MRSCLRISFEIGIKGEIDGNEEISFLEFDILQA